MRVQVMIVPWMVARFEAKAALLHASSAFYGVSRSVWTTKEDIR